MPPRRHPKRLTRPEKELLERWVRQGAGYEGHWAYVRPVRPRLPVVRDASWPRTAIDVFVLAGLEGQGLTPTPEAQRATLIRRLSLDLTGLPPTPAEVASFEADRSASAYEKVVDRLLASPEFGERWARPWLDLARYADSHGFQRDDLREIWAYRDWVIRALNHDMPFDQFTIEQVAGDLLPDPSTEQIVATGFHRSTPTNVEAGSEPEESRINQVLDRVNTTGAVWLGATLECARCHDHKYDPIAQKEYYRLLAFFNNTESEVERANPKVPSSIKFRGPSLTLEDEATRPLRTRLQEEIAAPRGSDQGPGRSGRPGQQEWEIQARERLGRTDRQAKGDGPPKGPPGADRGDPEAAGRPAECPAAAHPQRFLPRPASRDGPHEAGQGPGREGVCRVEAGEHAGDDRDGVAAGVDRVQPGRIYRPGRAGRGRRAGHFATVCPRGHPTG